MSLESESKCDFMMLKTPLKKTEKSLALPVTFLSFFNFIYVILIVVLFPVWTNKFGRYLIYLDLTLGILSIILWLRTQFSDPGFIKKPKDVDFLKLMQMVDPIQLCPDCLVIRTPRSRHCSTCNQCVERFDHHCPWINNCIGVKNHMYFMFFLSTIMLTIGVLFITICY